MMTASPIANYRECHEFMTLEEFGRLFSPPVDKSTVLRWERGKITAERAVQIETVTGIPRSSLRPDIFKSMEAAE
jgi:hypothetical protein